MRLCVLILLALLPFQNAYASRCTGTTIEINICLKKEIKKAETKLENKFRMMVASIKNQQKNALEASQTAWKSFFAKELEFVSLYWSGGTYSGVRYGYTKLEMLEGRARELDKLIKP